MTQLILLASFVFVQIKCNNSMKDNFCEDLINDKRANLKKEVNTYLSTLTPQIDHEPNFQKIKTWIESHDCVTSVTIQPGEIRTKPPIKDFLIEVLNNGVKEQKKIGIRFSETRYEINIQLHEN